MPSYNHAAFVTEAIESVLDQSHGDLELVITDDGSRDGTPDVIRRLADRRIDLEVFEKNQRSGGGDECVDPRASRGEFICMLASDDCFLPGKLERQVKFLRAEPACRGGVRRCRGFIDQRGAPLADSFNGDVVSGAVHQEPAHPAGLAAAFLLRGKLPLSPGLDGAPLGLRPDRPVRSAARQSARLRHVGAHVHRSTRSASCPTS